MLHIFKVSYLIHDQNSGVFDKFQASWRVENLINPPSEKEKPPLFWFNSDTRFQQSSASWLSTDKSTLLALLLFVLHW